MSLASVFGSCSIKSNENESKPVLEPIVVAAATGKEQFLPDSVEISHIDGSSLLLFKFRPIEVLLEHFHMWP